MILQSLRPQLTVAMAATSMAVAVFIFAGLMIYDIVSVVIEIGDQQMIVEAEYAEGEPGNDIFSQGEPVDGVVLQSEPVEGVGLEGELVDGVGLEAEAVDGIVVVDGGIIGDWPMWPDIFATLGISLAGSAIGGLIGFRYAHRIAQPIETLASSARALADGDLTVRAHPRGEFAKEIEKLTEDFNFMAEELDRAHREQVESTSAIAHELRTPVTVLRGRLQGMSDGVFKLNRDALKGLIAQTDTLNRIIEDLRSITLSQSGKLELSPIAIDLSEEVQSLLLAVKPLVENAGLSVTAILKPAPANADPIRMGQAISALIENAKLYAAEGGELTIETGKRDGFVYVRIMDRGPGLNTVAAVRIFDRFWRADSSRSRRYGGSGLGLAVVKAICKGHGGDVTYTDREGGGSVFEILIPARSS